MLPKPRTRILTAGALALVLALAVPAAAGAAPLSWTDAGALFAGAWHRLLSLWGEEGLGIDPNGRPSPPVDHAGKAPADDSRPTAIWGEEGLGIDPNGRPAPTTVAGSGGQG